MPKGTPLRRGEGLKARRAENIVFILTCLPNSSLNHSSKTLLCSATGRDKTHRKAGWVPSAWPESLLRMLYQLRNRQEPILQLKHMKLKCRPKCFSINLMLCVDSRTPTKSLQEIRFSWRMPGPALRLTTSVAYNLPALGFLRLRTELKPLVFKPTFCLSSRSVPPHTPPPQEWLQSHLAESRT